MKKRFVFRIELSSDVPKHLLGISDRIGITQIALASKLITWLASQPKDIQTAVIEGDPQGELATAILKQVASGKPSKHR